MDFLKEAKAAAAELKSLNEKIAGPAPNDADPAVISKLQELYGAFKQKEEAKAGTIDSWFTTYKKYKKEAKASGLTKIKSLLTEIKAAAESELAYCLQYVNDIETCIQTCPTLEYSTKIESIRRSVASISNNLTQKPLIPPTVITELDGIINDSNTLAANIKSGKVQYKTIEDAVVQSKIQTKVIKYRDPLLTRFCKLFAIEAANKPVKATDYLGFTCCLTYIVFIMKITGAKVKKVDGLANLQKVNDTKNSSDDPQSKKYKKLLGGGWLAKVIYNTLSAALPPANTSTMDSV